MHNGKSSVSVFQEIIASTDKFYIISTSIILWSFEILLIFLNILRSKVLSRLATRLANCTYQLITNNHASFHFWWKENLINHQDVSKYHEQDCLQHFYLLFVFINSFNNRLSVRKSYFCWNLHYLKKCPRPNLAGVQYQTGPQWKDWESSYHAWQILVFFSQISCSNFRLKLCQRP